MLQQLRQLIIRKPGNQRSQRWRASSFACWAVAGKASMCLKTLPTCGDRRRGCWGGAVFGGWLPDGALLDASDVAGEAVSVAAPFVAREGCCEVPDVACTFAARVPITPR